MCFFALTLPLFCHVLTRHSRRPQFFLFPCRIFQENHGDAGTEGAEKTAPFTGHCTAKEKGRPEETGLIPFVAVNIAPGAVRAGKHEETQENIDHGNPALHKIERFYREKKCRHCSGRTAFYNAQRHKIDEGNHHEAADEAPYPPD